MGKKIKSVLILLVIHQFGWGQMQQEIKWSSDFIEVDKLENIYLVKGAELRKYDPSGNFLFSYSNKINGIISSVDATNPLRVIVFYKESNTIAFLNQQLALISDPIDIYNAANVEATLAGGSSGGSFWVFSVDRQCLMLFDSRLEKVQESQNLSGWISEAEPGFIREFDQKVYLGLGEKVLVFDMFGSYLTALHFKDATFLKVLDGQISYFKDDKIGVYNISLRTDKFFPNSQLISLKYSFFYKSRIYNLSEKSVVILPIK